LLKRAARAAPERPLLDASYRPAGGYLLSLEVTMGHAREEVAGSAQSWGSAHARCTAVGHDLTVATVAFGGDAANEFGTPYRTLGLPLRCALEVATRLGPIARPLEALLRIELQRGNFVAAQALGRLGEVGHSSIEELAAHLDCETNKLDGFADAIDLAAECAVALVRLDQAQHPVVLAALKASSRASADFDRYTKFVLSRG